MYKAADGESASSHSKEVVAAPAKRVTPMQAIRDAFNWYLGWSLPGLGMFSEAYIVFAVGQVGVFQKAMWPSCYSTFEDCNEDLVKHVDGYIQICGIILGMLVWGVASDYVGRKWGSRCVAGIMLSGCILLTFTPYATSAAGYHAFFMVAQTWYGVGVGGEYPLASSSAAERADVDPNLQAHRGQQVVLVFSGQGMGNFVNAVVILLCMAIFSLTGPAASFTFSGSQSALILTYGIGAVLCLVMVVYRAMFLKESKMYEKAGAVVVQHRPHTIHGWRRHLRGYFYYWPRLLVASGAWIANDFAFYGNRLQQNKFISYLYPTATPYVKQQWTVLNSAIALTGYWTAAALVDAKWYGRVRMQTYGFVAMFILFIIIYGQWDNMGGPNATVAGVHAFQALYYLSSWWNQMGPNSTTWLVAGEIFPTEVRASYHGFSAAMGKLGAIIASLWFSYISDQKKVFLVSAIWGLAGAIVTIIFLPEVNCLPLEELDRLQRYIMEGRFSEYHGLAVHRRHISLWEAWVLGWHKQYDEELDRQALIAEQLEAQKEQKESSLELSMPGDDSDGAGGKVPTSA